MDSGPDIELTGVRVNRILRPLRAKCAHLAALPSAVYSSHTYASNPRKYGASDPMQTGFAPLQMLPSPGILGAKAHLDRHGISLLEQSRRLYAIRDWVAEFLKGRGYLLEKDDLEAEDPGPVDAWRLHKALRALQPEQPQNSGSTSSTPQSRLSSLRDLCAIVVGTNIEALAEPDSDSENGSQQPEELWQHQEMVYRYVPCDDRRRCLIAQIISHIIHNTPRNTHPTLIPLLISIFRANESPTVVSFKLEIRFLLRSLLRTCLDVTARNSKVFPSWLIDLHSTFTGTEEEERLFLSTFADAALELQSVMISEFWTSRPVKKFVRALRKNDNWRAYSTLLSTLAGIIRELDTTQGGAPDTLAMREHLSAWLYDVVRIHYSTYIRCSTDEEDEDDAPIQDRSGFYENTERLLDEIYACDLHLEDPLHSHRFLSDMVSNSVIALVTLMAATTRLAHDDSLFLTILKSTAPRPQVYWALADLILERERYDERTPYNDGVMANSRRLSSFLRAHKLLVHDALLWAAVLKKLERTGGRKKSEEWMELRKKLVQEVEEAEARRFGRNDAVDGEEWAWEETIGAWILLNPPPPPELEESNDSDDGEEWAWDETIGMYILLNPPPPPEPEQPPQPEEPAEGTIQDDQGTKRSRDDDDNDAPSSSGNDASGGPSTKRVRLSDDQESGDDQEPHDDGESSDDGDHSPDASVDEMSSSDSRDEDEDPALDSQGTKRSRAEDGDDSDDAPSGSDDVVSAGPSTKRARFSDERESSPDILASESSSLNPFAPSSSPGPPMSARPSSKAHSPTSRPAEVSVSDVHRPQANGGRPPSNLPRAQASISNPAQSLFSSQRRVRSVFGWAPGREPPDESENKFASEVEADEQNESNVNQDDRDDAPKDIEDPEADIRLSVASSDDPLNLFAMSSP